MGSKLYRHQFWVLIVKYPGLFLWRFGDKFRFTSSASPMPPLDNLGCTNLEWLCYLMGVDAPKGI